MYSPTQILMEGAGRERGWLPRAETCLVVTAAVARANGGCRFNGIRPHIGASTTPPFMPALPLRAAKFPKTARLGLAPIFDGRIPHGLGLWLEPRSSHDTGIEPARTHQGAGGIRPQAILSGDFRGNSKTNEGSVAKSRPPFLKLLHFPKGDRENSRPANTRVASGREPLAGAGQCSTLGQPSTIL